MGQESEPCTKMTSPAIEELKRRSRHLSSQHVSMRLPVWLIALVKRTYPDLPLTQGVRTSLEAHLLPIWTAGTESAAPPPSTGESNS